MESKGRLSKQQKPPRTPQFAHSIEPLIGHLEIACRKRVDTFSVWKDPDSGYSDLTTKNSVRKTSPACIPDRNEQKKVFRRTPWTLNKQSGWV